MNMTKSSLRIVRFLCLLAIIIFLIILFGNFLSRCSSWIDVENEKVEEMNTELKNLLSNRYMLYINDDVIFIEGYYDNAFQDSSIYLTLKIPNNSITDFYNKEHYSEEDFLDDDIYKRLTYDGELYTHMDFYTHDAEYTLVKFTGRIRVAEQELHVQNSHFLSSQHGKIYN